MNIHTLTYVKIKTSIPWNIDGVDVWLHSSLTLALDGGELLISYPGHYTLGKGPLVPFE
jgi:hypothetical protein